MNLHEYQAKKLFAEYGIPIPPGKPAFSVGEALAHAAALGGEQWVVKAQVHAGGRGKAGGVKLVNGVEELQATVRALLGRRLVTVQSGPVGQPVNCVLVQSCIDIARELYLSLLVDRASRRLTVIASAAGGMDIEEAAARDPASIARVAVDPILGLQNFQCRRVAKTLRLEGDQVRQLTGILQALHRLFLERDLSLVEINPLVVDRDAALQALDAKVTIDDNALFRQPLLAEWRDLTQEDPTESAARHFDLNYVTMQGSIACMVNGAGLAMATMDTIKLHGGEPANFLDVGGGTNADKVAEAFKLIVADPKVKAILVNIFGGIVRCDLIAEGIVRAVREVGVTVPVIVRLEGTNVEAGRRLLDASGLALIAAEDLDDGAAKAVAAAGG